MREVSITVDQKTCSFQLTELDFSSTTKHKNEMFGVRIHCDPFFIFIVVNVDANKLKKKEIRIITGNDIGGKKRLEHAY